MTPEQATHILAKCAAYDPLFAKPNQSMAHAWAEGFSRYDLALDDALEAVSVHYTTVLDRSTNVCAALIQAARKIRSDRRDRYEPLAIAAADDARDRSVLAKVRARQRELGIGDGDGRAGNTL